MRGGGVDVTKVNDCTLLFVARAFPLVPHPFLYYCGCCHCCPLFLPFVVLHTKHLADRGMGAEYRETDSIHPHKGVL